MPATLRGVVIVFVTVSGHKGGGIVQESYANTVCGRIPATGFVRQEEVPLDAFPVNRFGRVYATAPGVPEEVAPAKEGL